MEHAGWTLSSWDRSSVWVKLQQKIQTVQIYSWVSIPNDITVLWSKESQWHKILCHVPEVIGSKLGVDCPSV